MIHLLFAIVGWAAGIIVNLLADFLPANRHTNTPPPFLPAPIHHASAIVRQLLSKDDTPNQRHRLLVEIGLIILFAGLPALITHNLLLPIHALYIAILTLVIVIDIEHRLILHIVTFPTTIIALLLSFIPNQPPNPLSALLGAVAGFLFFFIFFLIGNKLYGAGALGFGDVTLSMMMGAMLGFAYIFFALIGGILIGGILTLLLLLFRRKGLKTYIPYGPYLAIGGILMLIWGPQIFTWYFAR